MKDAVRIGVDIGGTFTDFVLVGTNGQSRSAKVLTNHDDHIAGLITGLRELLSSDQAALKVESIVHGTTVVTNAVIERSGATTALITTAGFEDVLEIGREHRTDLYDLGTAMPEPIVSRKLRYGVQERTTEAGEIIVGVQPRELQHLASQLITQGVQAVAICFLHAWRNPRSEQEALAVLRAHLPHIHFSLSSDIDPHVGEYERSVTTVVNAFCAPRVEDYLRRLEGSLASEFVDAPPVLRIVRSDGRLTDVSGAINRPIDLLESGPAGGCLAAALHGVRCGHRSLIGFDMGGTTAKSSLIVDGQPLLTGEFEAARTDFERKGSGLPVRLQTVDLLEIGTGGGSIARIDALGFLQVGPRSAASKPGPACYGLGGTEPTVTDANVVLGYLDEDVMLGGRVRLDHDAARVSMTSLASRLGLEIEEVAFGIHRVASENMARSTRSYLLERGYDPRRFPLCAFGGSGPVHAYRIAKLLGTSEILVPPSAGVCSALGFLTAPAAVSRDRELVRGLDQLDFGELQQIAIAMTTELAEALAQKTGSGRVGEAHYSVGIRTRGHPVEVSVPFASTEFNNALPGRLSNGYLTRYRSRFGAVVPTGLLEIVSLRAELICAPPRLKDLRHAHDARQPEPRRWRPVMFEAGAPVVAPTIERDSLAPGVEFVGPAIVVSNDTTIVVPPDARLKVFEDLTISLLLAEVASASPTSPSSGAAS